MLDAGPSSWLPLTAPPVFYFVRMSTVTSQGHFLKPHLTTVAGVPDGKTDSEKDLAVLFCITILVLIRETKLHPEIYKHKVCGEI